MKRHGKALYGLLFAGLTIVAAACSPNANAATTVQAEEDINTLVVSGYGTVSVAPDIAQLSAGVETFDKDAAVASAENVRISNAIAEALTKSGIEEKDIQTRNYRINPEYNYETKTTEGAPRLIGYRVNNSLYFKMRNTADVGKIIDACVAAGANNVSSLDYAVENSSKHYTRVYKKAMDDAKGKAQAIAAAMGKTLSEPVSVTEGGSQVIMPRSATKNAAYEMAADMDYLSGAGVSNSRAFSGELEVSASVTVMYSYK